MNFLPICESLIDVSYIFISVLQNVLLPSLFTRCPIVEMKGPTSWKFKAEERRDLKSNSKLDLTTTCPSQLIHWRKIKAETKTKTKTNTKTKKDKDIIISESGREKGLEV